jgi:hypothetical protein
MTNMNMEVASRGNAQTMQVASQGNAQTMQVVVALNVVDLDEYVKKTELDSMHVMTWGNENPEE